MSLESFPTKVVFCFALTVVMFEHVVCSAPRRTQRQSHSAIPGRIRNVKSTNKRHNKPPFCEEPSDLGDIIRQLQSPDDLHSSFYSLPSLRRLKIFAHSVPRTVQKSSSVVIGDRRCPHEVNYSPGDYLERSTCPVYHVITHDRNRLPATMVEVECKCRACLSLSNAKGKLLADCKKIYYHTPVLRKTCDRSTGKFVYRKLNEPISVGCTCAARSVSESIPRSSQHPPFR